MSDPVSAARTARETLARALSALQSPGVPEPLMAVAEPVAHAMSWLHRIESTAGAATAEAGTNALNAARHALATLQPYAGQHAPVDQAVEAIANSLGVIHQLAQTAPGAAPAASAFAGTMLQERAPAAHEIGRVTQPSQATPYGARPEPKPQVAYVQPSADAAPRAPAQPPNLPRSHSGQQWRQTAPSATAQPAVAAPPPPQRQPTPPPQQQWQQPPQAPPPQQWQQPPPAAQAQPPQQWQQPPQAPPAQQWQQPAPAAAPQQWQQPVQAQAPPMPQGGAAGSHALAPAGGPQVEAALGAHSATNFYKGLSGNDVVDSGGIFVATYQIPDVGSQLTIRVSMPGGYEFEALAVVRWTREAPNSGSDSPPGFGAQFTQISAEGRQLIYRYVRNREPLFHDDL